MARWCNNITTLRELNARTIQQKSREPWLATTMPNFCSGAFYQMGKYGRQPNVTAEITTSRTLAKKESHRSNRKIYSGFLLL